MQEKIFSYIKQNQVELLEVIYINSKFLKLQPAYVVHIFPSCDFANDSLSRIAPDLLSRVAELAHLLIVIATV